MKIMLPIANGPKGSVLLLLMTFLAVLMVVFWKRLRKYNQWVHLNIIGNGGQ